MVLDTSDQLMSFDAQEESDSLDLPPHPIRKSEF